MMPPAVSNASDFSANPTLPGTVLAGKYRVERVLGQGGMGVVVEARHMQLDERVALKFLLPEYAKHPEAAARFLREARNAVKIKSEHVARVSDVGTLDSGAPYMVMEYLEGRDLSGVLQKTGIIAISDAVDYIIQGCEAIAEAHSHGIVHRDIKPANLFLSKRPDGMPIVKVLDFGISKGGTAVDNLTKTMTSLGSALYMSPEQMQQTRSVDHRTDVYALGISLYELLAGKQPFYADTLPQLCAEVLTGIATPLRQARPDVPEPLALIIERAYARDRANRFQSVAELVVALAPFAPPRTQNTIERVARLGGLPIPPSTSSGVFTTPAAVVPLAAPAPAAYPTPAQQAQQAQPGQPQAFPPTVPLPVMDPTAGQGAPPGFVPAPPPAPVIGAAPSAPPPRPAPSPPGSHQIVPGPYSGPVSVRAAASFAQGATTNAALYTSGAPGQSKAGIFVMVVLALLTVGGGGALLALKLAGPKVQASSGNATSVTTVEMPGPTAPNALPVSPPSDDTAKPVETAKAVTSASPVDTAKAADSTQPSATAAPTSHPKGHYGGHPGGASPGPAVTPPPAPPVSRGYDPKNPF
jgi:serine/threonine protein kinase